MVGYGLFPSWSPDKTVDRIAYQRAGSAAARWFSLWTMDLVDGEGRRMTEVAVSTNAAIVSPALEPGRQAAGVRDGRAAQPRRPRRRQGGTPARRGQQDIWTVDADGANRQRLTDGNGTNLCPFWAADNRVYFVSDRGGNESVWSVRADSARAIDVARRGGRTDAKAGQDRSDGTAGGAAEPGRRAVALRLFKRVPCGR